MRYLIRNGRLVDPALGLDAPGDILVDGAVIEKAQPGLPADGATVIDAGGMIVAPGFLDLHAHLREPGREDKETVFTGTRAAVHGGFTGVACMPNTDPAIDTAGTVARVREIASRDGACAVHVIGAITRGREGKELADFAGMKKAGAVAVSDDGSPVTDPALMARALESAKKAGLPVIAHCEDAALSARGVINRGFVSTKTGLRGIPAAAEYEAVRRDVALAAQEGARIHIAHVSCRGSVDVIREAKARGVAVTAETCPHYFTLTDECCVTYDTTTKMNPPLRTADDVRAVKEGLRDGTIDAIATDHAPHTDSEKDVEFDAAPFGIIGLETALALAAMELIGPGVLSWPQLIMKLACAPAGIIGIAGGALQKGGRADITVIDPGREWTYTRDMVASRSKNSPFLNWKLKGRVMHVLSGGKLAVRDGKVVV